MFESIFLHWHECIVYIIVFVVLIVWEWHIYIYIHTGHFVLKLYHNSFQMCLYYIIDFTFLYCVGYFFLSVSLLYISVIILRFLISLSTRDAGLECMFKFCKIIDGNGRLGMRLESCGPAPARKYSVVSFPVPTFA